MASMKKSSPLHQIFGLMVAETVQTTWMLRMLVPFFIHHFNPVLSLLTVPVPKLRLELDREGDSLLFVRVPHERVHGVVPR